MAESTRLVDLVQERIDQFLEERSPQLSAISDEIGDFVGYSREVLSGGKRFRALFCYWGWQSVSSPGVGFDVAEDSAALDLPGVVSAAAALELFHAAALVHDDIMDKSDTRRGRPAAHRRFETLHRESGWTNDATAFGGSAGLLLGDLLLGWSDELFDEGLRALADPAAAAAGRKEFNRMRAEVTVGQYLDIVEENAWRIHPESELLPRAHRVIVYKSAKYSVEAPLAIGAALGGGTSEQSAALREFGLPLGVAYQLRDDLLGVFGDPAVTGKPAGDDLREGKRTVLIALARPLLPGNARSLLDELLGDPELDAQQVEVLQNVLRESGAIDRVERIIAHNVGRAKTAIVDAPLSASSRTQLLQLADTVIRRTA
ncbi:polyprenyl synthetase family protein [Conyzicola lurida]|uniref:polyprenyl synthetase family protein n=1 Tax=Conyzicola lurida TaxID=1172621 RepID=UPI00160B7AED